MPEYQIPMNIPEFVGSVIKRLQTRGFKAYVVGGSIRDLFLERPATDWDIATSASPEEIKGIFHDIRSFCLKHETVTLVYRGGNYEVTTIRDSKGSAQAIEEDLGHRDFTINAMAYDIDLKIALDPNGGRNDIARKIIKAVGDPSERFREDPVRLLRAVRFAAELGFKIEKRTMETILLMSDWLASAARERVRDEFMKILMTERPSNGFKILRRSGLLTQILPELLEGFMKRQDSHHQYTIYRHIMETIDRTEPEPIIRLTALLHDIAKSRVRKKIKGKFCFFRHAEESALLAGAIMERLRFSNEMIKGVTNLIAFHMVNYNNSWSDGAIRRLIRRVGEENISSLVSFLKADFSAHGQAAGNMRLLKQLETRMRLLKKVSMAKHTCDLAIGGHKVMDILGIPPGPGVGRVLNLLLERVTDQPELNTEQGLYDLLKEIRETAIKLI